MSSDAPVPTELPHVPASTVDEALVLIVLQVNRLRNELGHVGQYAPDQRLNQLIDFIVKELQ